MAKLFLFALPSKFDFAFVLDKNIGLKYFPISQALVTFTVTSEDAPVTLQQSFRRMLPLERGANLKWPAC